jgi:hypothetical protein
VNMSPSHLYLSLDSMWNSKKISMAGVSEDRIDIYMIKRLVHKSDLDMDEHTANDHCLARNRHGNIPNYSDMKRSIIKHHFACQSALFNGKDGSRYNACLTML